MVNNCPPIRVSTVKICLSAGASLNSGCSVNTMLYPKRITINTKAILNIRITNRFVSALSCSVVLGFAINRFCKIFGTGLRGDAEGRFAVIITPMFRVLAMVSVPVITATT